MRKVHSVVHSRHAQSLRICSMALSLGLGCAGTAIASTLAMDWPAQEWSHQSLSTQTETATLTSGAPLHHAPDPSLPRVSVAILFKGGPGLLPISKQGVMSLNSMIFDQGPATMSLEAFRHKLFMLQGAISFSSQPRALSVSVTAPPHNLAQTLALAMDILDHPRYDQDTFQDMMARSLSLLKTSSENMRTVMSYFAPRHAFGWHPDTLDGATSLASMPTVTLDDLASSKDKLYDFAHALVFSTGPLTTHEVRDLLDTAVMARTPGKIFQDITMPPLDPQAYAPAQRMITVIHKEGIPDNQVFFIDPRAIPFDTPDRVAGLIAFDVLGGGLSGRLMKSLRTEQGLTYGIGASLSGSLPMWGYRTFGTRENLQALITGSEAIIEKFCAEGITEQEFQESKKQIEVSFREGIEMPSDMLAMVIKQTLYHHDPAYFVHFLDHLKTTTREDVQKFAQKTLHTKNGRLYLIGNSKELLPLLKSMGYSEDAITVLDINTLP